MKWFRHIFYFMFGIVVLFCLTACGKKTSSSWDAAPVIQKMNKIAIIEHPQQWQTTIKKYDYGKKIHSLKTLNQVLYIGNKHAHAVSSMKGFEDINYPNVTSYNNLKIINIPSFYSLKSKPKHKYVKILRSQVERIPKNQPIILNFANNTGGDYTVMINGLACLIPNGHLWSETSRNGKKYRIMLTSHEIKRNHKSIRIKLHHFLNREILIITNEYTASAAEFAVIALKRNHNVKTIGYPTAGYITGTTGFKFGPSKKYVALIPNAKIITTSLIKGKKVFCNDPIIPDIQTLYRPINNSLSSKKLKQTPLDRDFVKELKKAEEQNEAYFR